MQLVVHQSMEDLLHQHHIVFLGLIPYLKITLNLLMVYMSFKTKRDRLKTLLQESIDKFNDDTKVLVNELLKNYDNHQITKDIYLKLKDVDLGNEINSLKDYIETRTVVALGGDGWAYDIGFNGIDHVLSSNENIKVMVLDTEVYSTPIDQMSKSSHMEQGAEFAGTGKSGYKRYLRIATSYPNTYVASICLGGNIDATITSMKSLRT